MIQNDLNKVTQRWTKDNQPSLAEANIIALGKTSEHYSIQLRNTSRITNVVGPTGLKVGDSVMVASYSGKVKRSVILGKSYKASTTATVIWV